jgi:gliding motility-associated-like protein
MKYFLIIICVFFNINIFAQKERNIWYFCDSSGIDFNSVIPYPLADGNLSSEEGCATISDSAGNLLFYTNGITVWNKLHQIMPNGILAVNPSFCDVINTITQNSLIIPLPNHSGYYYLFTLSNFTLPYGGGSTLKYSLINMNLDNGNGDIIFDKKNIQLSSAELTEQLFGVKHGNGLDWWVLTHEFNSDVFYKYLITSYGIEGPFTQNIGSMHGGTQYVDDRGQISVNPQGNKLCIVATNVVDLFDFDRCTGKLSNWKNLDSYNPVILHYGCAFSPDGNILYVTYFFYDFHYRKIFQFNVASDDILQSKFEIWSIPDSIYFGQYQLGPDGKIYLASFCQGTSNIHDTINKSLSVINNPDSLGSKCNFIPYSFNIEKKKIFSGGLPNLPNYNLGALVGSICDTIRYVEPNKQTDIFIPTAFTPNNDGQNDILYVRGGLKNMEIKIFNQWGLKVFETNEQSRGWNGIYKGEKQPTGNYVYMFKATTTQDKEIIKNGVLSLIR